MRAVGIERRSFLINQREFDIKIIAQERLLFTTAVARQLQNSALNVIRNFLQ